MADGDITLTMDLDTNKVKTQIAEIKQELQQMTSSINTGAMNQGFHQIVVQLDTAIARAEQLIVKMEQMNNTQQGGNTPTTSPQYQQMQQQLEAYANQIALANAQVEQHAGKVTHMSKRAVSAFGNVRKSFQQAFNTRTLSRFVKRLASVAFGVYSVTALFNKLRQATKEGLNNLVQYQSATNETNHAMTELQTSLLFLKNAWGSAFAPIVNMVMPYLTQLIDAIATVGNTIARFVGALTGQSKVLQAVKVGAGDYAKSLNKVGGSAKKATDRLAQFDDLNVLGKDSDEGGGGGGASGPDPSEMFEYVDVDKGEFADILDWIDKIKKKIDESGIKEAIGNLWDALQRFKDSEFYKTMKKIIEVIADSTFTSALSVLTNLFNLMADILNGDLNGGLEDFKKLIADLTFDPWITLAGVFDTIFGTDVAGWVESVKQSVEDIDLSQLPGYDKLVSALEELTTAWDNFKTAIKNFWDMLEETGVLDVLKDVITELVSIAFDVFLQGVATALGLIADALTIITACLEGDGWGVLDGFKDTLADLHFEPLQTIASIFDHIVGTDISGWIEGVHEKVEAFHFEDFANSISESWEKIKSAFWLGVGIISSLLGITDDKVHAISASIKAVIGQLAQWWTVTWTAIKNTVLTVATAISNTVRRVFEQLLPIIRPVINTIIGCINVLIGAIEGMVNRIASALNNIKIDIPDWVPDWGGKQFGFNIGTISLGRIPQLAEGAVIPPNKEFMAVLGDQSHGTNIEAPLDTIKQAVAEELSAQIEVLESGFASVVSAINSKDLTIGDKEIGKANARYNSQQRIIRGTSF